MHASTMKSVAELLATIERMKKAFNASNHAEIQDSADQLSPYLAFCRAMGAVEGQSKVVRINLEVYEAVHPEAQEVEVSLNGGAA